MKHNILKLYTVLTLFTLSIDISIAQVGINTTKPAGIFHIDGKGDNITAAVGTDDIVVDNKGRMGIGMVPADVSGYVSRLQINGGITYKNGTQGAGKVLISDDNGIASWGEVSAYTQTVVFGSGVYMPYNTTGYLQSGTSFLLPPGRYAVNISILFRFWPIIAIPQDSYIMVRFTFSNSNAASGATASPDLENTNYMFAQISELSAFAFSVGTFIIHNSTSADKRYYLIGGNTSFKNITSGEIGFAMPHLENSIIIYKLSN